MKFEENEPLIWVSGSYTNPRKIPCYFVKLSNNPEKCVIKITSRFERDMRRVVMIENVMKAKGEDNGRG